MQDIYSKNEQRSMTMIQIHIFFFIKVCIYSKNDFFLNVLVLFIKAIQEGRIDILKFLFDVGIDLSKKNNEGFNLAHVACFENQLEILEFLYDIDMNLDEKSVNGTTPLYIGTTLVYLCL